MRSEFEDENDAFAYIVERLSEALDAPVAVALAEQFVVRCEMGDTLDDWVNGESTEVAHSIVGAPWWGPWTVRDEELKDIKELAVGVLAGWTVPNIPELVPLVMSAACMVWRLRERGAHLNPLQRDVLVALRRHGSLVIETLVVEASAFGTNWTPEEVCGALAELSAIRLRNGAVVSLVNRDADGVWSSLARVWEVPFGSYSGDSSDSLWNSK